MSDRVTVLAFQPFDAGSHRAVRESITRHSRHDWRWITRPGRAWKWRMRLGAIEMLEEAGRAGALDGPVDVVFATSLMSAADLRALLPARLRSTPLVLYMHENQAAFPEGPTTTPGDRERDHHFALTNLTSVLSADRVLWNSGWNRDSFLDGITRVLTSAPDAETGDLRARVLDRSVVAWPPVERPDSREATDPTEGAPIHVAWPHRWEHDKGPDALLELMAETADLPLRWTLLGQQFRTRPRAFDEILVRFDDRIEHAGYEPDHARYLERLRRCDWVVSTARHEFFGIAVVEAMLAGCLPWLPARLSYPELLPPVARGLSPRTHPADPEGVRRAVRTHLEPAVAAHAVTRIDQLLSDAAAV